MPSILTTANGFRAEVLRGDRATLGQLSNAYQTIEQSLRGRLNNLAREMAAARERGEPVNENSLRRDLRYQSLIRQVQIQIARFSNGASTLIQARQGDVINLGIGHASRMIEAAGVDISFVNLPTEALIELIGVLQDGTPLSRLLDELGPEAAKQIKEALLTGLGAGDGAAVIARRMRDGLDLPRWRALRIARTEIMRAYRGATLKTYEENGDVLNGWYWMATLSTRTCPACWSLHGKFFPLSKSFFPGHVNCRCTSVPSVKGSNFTMTPGAEAFAALPAAKQLAVLGPTRYEMYSNGTDLEEFVMLTRDKEWGRAYITRPIWQVRKRKAAA